MQIYTNKDAVEQAYGLAKEAYSKLGVDTDKALKKAVDIPVSVHCWQGDDVCGFEGSSELSGGGILATGNYPGRARNGDELRADAEFAFSLIPGKSRFNIHAMYGESDGKKVDRDKLDVEHFEKWIRWSREKGIDLDFNGSFFSHPMADSGYTLASADPKVRNFWLDHAKATRKIASAMGSSQGNPCVNNIWVPDGSKDIPADRESPRKRLMDALDEILSKKMPEGSISDAVECKLFGIGSEAYVVGSHEFYMGYTTSRNMKLCLDMGHFHPTETIHDKISSLLLYVPSLLLHVSRGVRWDSDHVALFSDDVREVFHEVARNNYYQKVSIALDFFDASINRIAAWAIGTRAARKAILESVLEPVQLIREAEKSGRLHERLALMEEAKTLPFSAVWDKLCLDAGVPVGIDWLSKVSDYEERILKKR